MFSNNLEVALKIGNEGIEQFYKKNYTDAKEKCIRSCRALQQLLNEPGRFIH